MGKDVEVVYQKGRDGNEGEEGKNQENIIAEERRIPRVFDREMEKRYEIIRTDRIESCMVD